MLNKKIEETGYLFINEAVFLVVVRNHTSKLGL